MPKQALTFPNDFINRRADQDIFDNLLLFNDDARLLAIEDKQGTGKSTLLKMLEYKCRWISSHPVSIVPLELSAINSPFTFIEYLRKSFGAEQTFKNFDALNQARVNKISSSFASPTGGMSGTVYAQGSVLGGSSNKQVGLEVTNPQQVIINPTADWSAEQEEFAKGECIKGFFSDLKLIGDENPLVVLLDSYERSSSDLRVWIRDDFLRPLCFNVRNRPAHLVSVLAGRNVPDFSALLGETRHKQLVKSRPLSGWEREHVEAFLKVHGYNLSAEDVDIVWAKVEKGFSIESAINLAQVLQG